MSGYSVAPGATVLAQSAVAVSTTGDTAEHTLATITIPAGAMGANGRVVIEANFSFPTSANNKTLRVKFGGTQIVSVNQTTTTGARHRTTVTNRNSASSQYATNDFLGASAAYATAAPTVDTTAAVDITITGILALGTETLTLESYQVLLYLKG